MKRVTIITLYGNENFGNKLQNYALQEYIKKNNFEVTTLTNPYMPYGKECADKLRHVKKIVRYFLKDKIDKEREKKIRLFSSKFLCLKKNNRRNIERIKRDTDIFVYGSDQIWNPNVISNFNIRLGLFAPKKKNIAYAPSFSVDKIDNKYIYIYDKAFKNMTFISCREKKGTEIIKKISNINSEVVLDPVFLLTKNDWEKLSSNYQIKKKYIFTYFLGELDESSKKKIQQLAKDNNLEIIDMLDKSRNDIYISDPINFISYIKNASLIFTDSFHAVAFSIIFNINFYVTSRIGGENMISRINNILSVLKLEKRLINKISNVNSVYKNTIDYNQVNKILEKEREKSRKFLEKALEIENKG